MRDLFNTGIRPLVDDWLLKKSKEQRDYGSYWSASSAGYCARRVIFERLGVPKVESDQDARKQRVFTSGALFHSWLQSITKEAGLSIAQELELQDESLMIRGHIDDLVLVDDPAPIEVEKEDIKFTPNAKWLIKQRLILYDYKTQNSKAFNYKRSEPNHYHKLQLGTYMYMLRKNERAFGNDIKYGDNLNINMPGLKDQLTEGRILKIEKDTLRMAEEQLLWSDDLEKEVVGYWKMLNKAWRIYIETAGAMLPKCTCSEHENGFLAKEAWNGYWFNNSPCSIDWFNKWKEENAN